MSAGSLAGVGGGRDSAVTASAVGLVDHAQGQSQSAGGSIFSGPDQQLNEDSRRVLEWISQVLNGNTRESALLELSKKREQVPELALILWHSFGE